MINGRKNIDRACQVCSKEFSVTPSKANRKYCSRDCQMVKQRRTKTYNCKQCGIEFRPKTRDRVSFCSRDCSYKHLKLNAKPKCSKLHYLKCQVCDKDFIYKRSNKKFCSDLCKRSYWKLYNFNYSRDKREKEKTFIQHACRICFELFMPKRCNQTVCSEKCNRIDAYYKRTLRRLDKGNYEIDGVDYVDPLQIFNRDNWHCRMCGESVAGIDDPTDLGAPELDHIVPLAVGGDHSMDNLQLLCRGCNISKGYHIVDELRQQKISNDYRRVYPIPFVA